MKLGAFKQAEEFNDQIYIKNSDDKNLKQHTIKLLTEMENMLKIAKELLKTVPIEVLINTNFNFDLVSSNRAL